MSRCTGRSIVDPNTKSFRQCTLKEGHAGFCIVEDDETYPTESEIELSRDRHDWMMHHGPAPLDTTELKDGKPVPGAIVGAGRQNQQHPPDPSPHAVVTRLLNYIETFEKKLEEAGRKEWCYGRTAHVQAYRAMRSILRGES